MSELQRIRAAVFTFGCRVNQYESDLMAGRLSRTMTVIDGSENQTSDLDVAILNACTVTGLAERKARQLARRLRRENPEIRILVIGCLPDAVRQGHTRFEEADLLAGGEWKPHIEDAVAELLSGASGLLPKTAPTHPDAEISAGSGRRVRAALKVQDGCSNACTYCRPTQVRGISVSKSIAASVEEARGLIRSGHPEIVLTGINLAQYAPEDGNLAALAQDILAVPGLRRLRLASINPSGVTRELLSVFAADPRACPHFHIPLQSGSDDLLRAMARGYTAAEYTETIDSILDILPHATFGSDIIVGFPGETDEAFAETCLVVERVAYVNLHVFRYSDRPGTVAARLPNRIDGSTKRRRAEALDSLWRPIQRRLLDRRIGTTQDILVEEQRDNHWRGYTSDYIPVHFKGPSGVPLGIEHPVRITGVAGDHLEGVDGHRTETD